MRLNYFHNRPKASKIDVTAYLYRINEVIEEPSLAYLKRLQRAHLINIPFENLDIHYGKKIILDYDQIFKKVVTNGRGGFCYELNGLFYQLLSNLGFDCFPISAQVWSEKKQAFGKDFDHMAIIVTLNETPWLVDVGFGEGIIYPKEVEINKIQMDLTRYWRIATDPDENLILQVSDDSNHFSNKYMFSIEEKQPIQFLGMCDYHQTSPESSFTQGKLITRLTTEGRKTLTDRSFKELALGVASESSIMNEDEFLSKLEQHFGISFHQLIPKRQ